MARVRLEPAHIGTNDPRETRSFVQQWADKKRDDAQPAEGAFGAGLTGKGAARPAVPSPDSGAGASPRPSQRNSGAAASDADSDPIVEMLDAVQEGLDTFGILKPKFVTWRATAVEVLALERSARDAIETALAAAQNATDDAARQMFWAAEQAGKNGDQAYGAFQKQAVVDAAARVRVAHKDPATELGKRFAADTEAIKNAVEYAALKYTNTPFEPDRKGDSLESLLTFEQTKYAWQAKSARQIKQLWDAAVANGDDALVAEIMTHCEPMLKEIAAGPTAKVRAKMDQELARGGDADLERGSAQVLIQLIRQRRVQNLDPAILASDAAYDSLVLPVFRNPSTKSV